MCTNGLDEYWVPENVKDYLCKLGFVLLLDDMEPWVRSRQLGCLDALNWATVQACW